MDIIPYEEKYVPRGFGFVNHSAMCYLNSLLQSLLSLPSLFNILNQQHQNKELINPLGIKLLEIYNQSMQYNNISDLNKNIYQELVKISHYRLSNSEIKFDPGQQDIHEALSLILDGLENIQGINRLFMHRYKWSVFCDKCKKHTGEKMLDGKVFILEPSLKNEQDIIFERVDPDFNKTMDLNRFIEIQKSCTDEFYACSQCKTKSKKFTETYITMVPEILSIMLKKYKEKILTDFPEMLTFTYIKDKSKKLIYRLVAQVEHLGGMSGGHYYAICKRSDGWKTLNDSSVSDGRPIPTPNTYMLFYHFDGIR